MVFGTAFGRACWRLRGQLSSPPNKRRRQILPPGLLAPFAPPDSERSFAFPAASRILNFVQHNSTFFPRGTLPMPSRRFFLAAALAMVALTNASCGKSGGKQDSAATAPHPTIVFMTDFGAANDAVAICKAVIVNIAPDARIMDITHQVTPYQIEEASRFLAAVSPYYPAGTVFLAVIDPGVGTSRKAVIVKTKKSQYFVLPDNGLITPVLDRDGLESAHEITNTTWMLTPAVSSTFHGRDIFSPAAAHLAAGWDYTIAGPVVPQLVRLSPKTAIVEAKGITGDIIGLDDPFG